MQSKLAVCVLGLSLLMISATPQQDFIRIESRLNQVEQRLYTMETSIRVLEQQSRMAGTTQRGGVSPEDLALLRAEIQALQLRLADDECNLARLDERTLAPAMRDPRRKSDPCRTNVNAPVRLPDQRP